MGLGPRVPSKNLDVLVTMVGRRFQVDGHLGDAVQLALAESSVLFLGYLLTWV